MFEISPQLKRIGLALRRELIWRCMPHGLLSPLYLWPWLGKYPTIHRQIWWYAGRRWPRPIWLIVQLWQWLRWVFFHAWVDTWHVWGSYREHVRSTEGIGGLKQLVRVLFLAIAWGVHPSQAYVFRLYRPRAQALSYVYDCELPAYHAWRSRFRKPTAESELLLTEKVEFAKKMKSLGVPVPETLGGPYPQSTPNPLKDLCRTHGSVFCKMTAGNQGRGAFAAWLEDGELRGETLAGAALNSEADVDAAWRTLCRLDRPLVQNLLRSHPSFVRLSAANAVLVLKVFMSWSSELPGHSSDVECLGATLHVPLQREGYAIEFVPLAVSTAGGHIRIPKACAWGGHSVTDISGLEGGAIYTGDGSLLPFWAEIHHWSRIVMQVFPDFHAIAFDWVVSPDGPILLEGNICWGVEPLQLSRRILE